MIVNSKGHIRLCNAYRDHVLATDSFNLRHIERRAIKIGRKVRRKNGRKVKKNVRPKMGREKLNRESEGGAKVVKEPRSNICFLDSGPGRKRSPVEWGDIHIPSALFSFSLSLSLS